MFWHSPQILLRHSLGLPYQITWQVLKSRSLEAKGCSHPQAFRPGQTCCLGPISGLNLYLNSKVTWNAGSCGKRGLCAFVFSTEGRGVWVTGSVLVCKYLTYLALPLFIFRHFISIDTDKLLLQGRWVESTTQDQTCWVTCAKSCFKHSKPCNILWRGPLSNVHHVKSKWDVCLANVSFSCTRLQSRDCNTAFFLFLLGRDSWFSHKKPKMVKVWNGEETFIWIDLAVQFTLLFTSSGFGVFLHVVIAGMSILRSERDFFAIICMDRVGRRGTKPLHELLVKLHQNLGYYLYSWLP